MDYGTVTWLASGLRRSKFPIDASNILDLEVAPEANPYDIHQAHPSISTPTFQASDDGLFPSPLRRISSARVLPSPTPSLHGAHQNFTDPAILSYGKAPSKTEPKSLRLSPKAQQSPISKEILVGTVKNSPTPALLAIPTKLSEPVSSKARQDLGDGLEIMKHDSLANATLSEPFDDLVLSANPKTEDESVLGVSELGTHVENGVQAQLEHVEAPIATTIEGGKQNGKRVRRGTRGGHRMRNMGVQATAPSTQPMEGFQSTILVTRVQKSSNTPKVQNQTPLVEADASMVASPSIFRKEPRNWQEKRASRLERTKTKDVQNGWATEDATDIQEMGNFDFAANLSKFNKHEVFSRLRRHDNTADEARLVSHNRAPKPGTGGGKNLHWTENVLSPPHPPDPNGQGKWNSEAGESENDLSDAKMSSGRSSRRDTSRTSFRRPQSRKGSAKAGESQNLVGSRVATGSLGIVRYSSFDQVGSPRPGRNLSISPFTGSISAPRPLLKIQGSNKTCPCLSPLQMLEFEQFAVSELGLSEDMMTENAARGIAETCLSAACSVDKVQDKHDRAPNPIIVIAVGNHKTGARAIAAGRHLRNHGFRVTVSLMGLDREEDLLDAVKQQANAYRRNGGTLLKPNELLEALKSKNVRPTILVDALLGIHTCFDDLRRDDQAFYFELVIWVNRALVEVFSVDVPSGLDPSSGLSSSRSTICWRGTLTSSRRINYSRRPTASLLSPNHPLPRRPQDLASGHAPRSRRPRQHAALRGRYWYQQSCMEAFGQASWRHRFWKPMAYSATLSARRRMKMSYEGVVDQ